jgi:DNA-binding NarL/FixJ family response regulator
MGLNPIRVLVVDADPGSGQALSARLAEMEGAEVVGLAHDRNAAKAEAETLEPDVLLVDLMLPGYRSIDIMGHVADTQPQIHILALAPADPPHDRIMLATEAGALGLCSLVCAQSSDPSRSVRRRAKGIGHLTMQLGFDEAEA